MQDKNGKSFFFFFYLCGLGPQRVTVGFTIPVTQGYRIKVSHNAKQVSNRNPKLKKMFFTFKILETMTTCTTTSNTSEFPIERVTLQNLNAQKTLLLC